MTQPTHSTDRMASAAMLPLVISMSIPTIIGNLSGALYNIISRIFIGNFVNLDALGAIALLFPLNNITSALSLLNTIGGAALISIAFGRKDIISARNTYSNMLFLTGIISVSLSFLYVCFPESLIQFCGASKNSALFPYAVTYLRITGIGNIFLLYNQALACVIRAEGHTLYSMFSCCIGAIVNTILCAVFLIPLHLGMAGAAFATLLGQFISFWVSLLYFLLGKSSLSFAGFHCVSLSTILHISFTGIASAIQQCLCCITNIIINHQLLAYGALAFGKNGGDRLVSIFSVINTVETLMIMIIMGINQGVSPIISYNYGHKNLRRTREASLFGQALASSITISIWLLSMCRPDLLFRLFGSDDAIIVYGSQVFRMAKPFLCFLGFQTLASLFFSAIEKPQIASIISIVRSALFIIPLLYLLPLWMGIDGVYRAIACSDLIATIIVTCFYFVGMLRLPSLMKLSTTVHDL